MITKVEKFNAIINAIDGMTFEGFDAKEFLEKEIEATKKKNARKSSTPSKSQRANAETKEKILALLADHADGMTATEVAKALDLSSPQKASALLRQLGDVTLGGSGDVKKEKVGKSTVFTLA